MLYRAIQLLKLRMEEVVIDSYLDALIIHEVNMKCVFMSHDKEAEGLEWLMRVIPHLNKYNAIVLVHVNSILENQINKTKEHKLLADAIWTMHRTHKAYRIIAFLNYKGLLMRCFEIGEIDIFMKDCLQRLNPKELSTKCGGYVRDMLLSFEKLNGNYSSMHGYYDCEKLKLKYEEMKVKEFFNAMKEWWCTKNLHNHKDVLYSRYIKTSQEDSPT